MAKKQYASAHEGGRNRNFRKTISTEFERMRIHFDYTYTLKHEKILISELIMPYVKKYLESTLMVRRFPGKMRFPKTAEFCGGLPIPDIYFKQGINADLIIFISSVKGVKHYNQIIESKNNKSDDSSNSTEVNNHTSSTNSSSHNTSETNRSKSTSQSLEEFEHSITVGAAAQEEELFFRREKKGQKNNKDDLNQFLDEFNKQNKGNKKQKSPDFLKSLSKRVTSFQENKNSTFNIFSPYEYDPEELSGVVGYSMQCLQDIYTLRPLAGQMHYVARIQPTQRSIEEAIWTTIHEITHILAFDYELFADFVDEDFNRKGWENTILLKTKFVDLESYIENTSNLTLWVENNTVITNWGISHPLHTSGGGFTSVDHEIEEIKANKNKTSNNSSRPKSTNTTIEKEAEVSITISRISGNNSNGTKNETKPKKKPKHYIFRDLEIGNTSKYIKISENFNLSKLYLTIENFYENVHIYIKTPRVVQTARAYFKCNNLKGVELEHFGGPGSAFSHWSKRILNTEFMIADSYGENYVSNFTLSLFEDSGWYKVNFENAQRLYWGKGKGCEFLQESCIVSSKSKQSHSKSPGLRTSNQMKTDHFRLFSVKSSRYTTKFPEYCTNFMSDTCSISKIFRGTCYLSNYTKPLPKDYQYFDDPRIGGATHFGDFCTYPLEWVDPFTGSPFGSCRNGVKFYPDLGEAICENCRCFMSTLVPTALKDEYAEKARSVCYEAKCKKDKNKVVLSILINDQELICPEKGGILSIDNYEGFIECPSSKEVCKGSLNPVQVQEEYSFIHGLSQKLLNVVLDFVDWLYNRV